VIDEAYINFSKFRSFTPSLDEYPNLVVLQTLSKAWGLAALRVGMAIASGQVVNIMNRIKPPYNINQASQELAIQSLDKVDEVNHMIHEIVKERKWLEETLPQVPLVKKIHPSDANFLLVQVTEPVAVYRYLLSKGIVVRDRSRVELCEGCLRITVGTPPENKTLIKALHDFKA
jgi:histidinol-phosphate aminotransferase